MAEEPLPKPVPEPDVVSRGFWESLRDTGKLAIQFCDRCSLYQHFPEPRCARCGLGDELRYKAVSGEGEVYTFVITHQTPVKSLAANVPYAIAWVELPEQKALRVVANIVNCDVASVRIGMRVRLVLERRGEWVIPQFEPAK